MVKNLPAKQELGFSPWVQKIPWEGMAAHFIILAWRSARDRGTWWATVYGVAKSWIRLND